MIHQLSIATAVMAMLLATPLVAQSHTCEPFVNFYCTYRECTVTHNNGDTYTDASISAKDCSDCIASLGAVGMAGVCDDSAVRGNCGGTTWCESHDSNPNNNPPETEPPPACTPRPGQPCPPCDPGAEGDECSSPIVIDFGAPGFDFTKPSGGVIFDLDADGTAEARAWTAADAGDAFLVLDRNGNAIIDNGSELFGNYTRQPASAEQNGYLALALFDGPEDGGNGDGRITSADAVWPSLRLWTDSSHDGISQPGELQTLDDGDVAAIELDYHTTRRRDPHGNLLRYTSRVWLTSGRMTWSTDVFLLR
jgi:hypothetical protein